jgi:hypothetical protein
MTPVAETRLALPGFSGVARFTLCHYGTDMRAEPVEIEPRPKSRRSFETAKCPFGKNRVMNDSATSIPPSKSAHHMRSWETEPGCQAGHRSAANRGPRITAAGCFPTFLVPGSQNAWEPRQTWGDQPEKPKQAPSPTDQPERHPFAGMLVRVTMPAIKPSCCQL